MANKNARRIEGGGGGAFVCAVEAMANDSRGQNRRRMGSKKEQPKINSAIPETSCPRVSRLRNHVIDVKKKNRTIFESYRKSD